MLQDSIVHAAKEMLPCKKKETKQSWVAKYILEKKRECKKAKSNDQAKCNRLGEETEMDCRRAKNEWWHTNYEEFETVQSHHRTREMHGKIRGHRKRT